MRIKILVIGAGIHSKHGTGITLGNMFGAIPKTQIAIITNQAQAELTYKSGYSNLYVTERDTPYKHIQQEPAGNKEDKPRQRSLTRHILHMAKVFAISHGLYYPISKRKLTPQLTEWITSFAPQVIYSMSFYVPLTLGIQKTFKLPIVVHIMDDWVQTAVKPGLLKNYWHSKINKELISLIDASKSHIAISPLMAKEYEHRYGHQWTVIHNPVALDEWEPHQKSEYAISGVFKMAYFGRWTTANDAVLNNIVKVIENLGHTIDIQLHLFVNTKGEDTEHVKYKGFIAHEELPQIMAEYDLLILPFYFDDEWMLYARLSMPTKVSEYMISGVPILLLSTKGNAVYDFCVKNKCSFICEDIEEWKIKKIITQIVSDEEQRRRVATNAKAYAGLHFSYEAVHAKFRECLDKAIQPTNND